MEGFEIFIEDFKPEVQKELLKFLGIRNSAEGNYDILPIAVVPKPEPEE